MEEAFTTLDDCDVHGCVPGGACGFVGFTYREEIKRPGRCLVSCRACMLEKQVRGARSAFAPAISKGKVSGACRVFAHAARSAGYLRTKTMDSAAQAKGRVLSASAFGSV